MTQTLLSREQADVAPLDRKYGGDFVGVLRECARMATPEMDGLTYGLAGLCIESAREIERLRATALRSSGHDSETAGWIPVTALPDNGVNVIAFYKNALGKGRRVRAFYAKPFTIEDTSDNDTVNEERDGVVYLTEGWYESNEHDEYFAIVQGEVICWQPLPAPPGALPTAPVAPDVRERTIEECARICDKARAEAERDYEVNTADGGDYLAEAVMANHCASEIRALSLPAAQSVGQEGDAAVCDCCGEATGLRRAPIMTGKRDVPVCTYCYKAWYTGGGMIRDAIKGRSLESRRAALLATPDDGDRNA